VPAITVNTFP